MKATQKKREFVGEFKPRTDFGDDMPMKKKTSTKRAVPINGGPGPLMDESLEDEPKKKPPKLDTAAAIDVLKARIAGERK